MSNIFLGIKKNLFRCQKKFFFGIKNFIEVLKKKQNNFYSFNFLFNIKIYFLKKKNYFSDYRCIVSNKKKMNSSESEQTDDENFCNEFLFAKDNRFEWKQLEINGVENNIVTIFDDTLIDLGEIKPFNLWEHNFNIDKFGHICSENLGFHYADTNNVCKPFFLKIENCCMTIRKGNHLKRVKYLEPFSIGISSILWQVHGDFVKKLKNEQIKK